MQEEILNELKKVKKASRQLLKLNDGQIAAILNELADLTLENEAFILSENQ